MLSSVLKIPMCSMIGKIFSWNLQGLQRRPTALLWQKILHDTYWPVSMSTDTDWRPDVHIRSSADTLWSCCVLLPQQDKAVSDSPIYSHNFGSLLRVAPVHLFPLLPLLEYQLPATSSCDHTAACVSYLRASTLQFSSSTWQLRSFCLNSHSGI